MGGEEAKCLGTPVHGTGLTRDKGGKDKQGRSKGRGDHSSYFTNNLTPSAN